MIALGFSLLGACSSGTSAADAGSDVSAVDVAPTDVTPDVTPDAGPQCPPHTHLVADGRCDAVLTFADTTEIPVARDHHGAVIAVSEAGPRLIVVGGAPLPPGASDQTTTNNVSIAPINPDGTLGAWSDGPNLAYARAGQAMGLIGSTVIAVAGRSTGSFLRSSTYATLQPDGTLSEWALGPSIPEGRFHISGAASGRWMYVSGGLRLHSDGTTEARPEVFGAQLDNDGALGAWQSMTALPEPISHHASFVHDGYLFIAGGLGGDPFYNRAVARRSAYRTRINPDGTLGAWEPLNQLPDWVSTHSATVHHDHVYLFGGVVDNGDNSDQILRAQLQSDGTLGAWETLPTMLPTVRSHLHYVPIYQGRAYFVSGSMRPHTPVATVWVGSFN